jgi:cytochrome c
MPTVAWPCAKAWPLFSAEPARVTTIKDRLLNMVASSLSQDALPTASTHFPSIALSSKNGHNFVTHPRQGHEC